jgi:hypothetical protein
MKTGLKVELVGIGFGLMCGGCMLGSAAEPDASTASDSRALASENGLTSINGLSGNGLTSINGLSGNGLSGNGLSGNGLSGNGLTSLNGLSGNGLSGNGLTSINGLSGNGLSGNGLTSINGLSGNGLSGNGLSGNGLTRMKPPVIASSLVSFKRLTGVQAVSGVQRMNVVARPGLWLANALRAENGLSAAAGLATDAGLANGVGLMSSENGRLIASYLVRCALPANRALSKYNAAGDPIVLQGAIGVAPEWEEAACGAGCQEWVSACLLAHVNLTGNHVPIWLTGEHPAIDWATSVDFPEQEAGFFGNLFSEPPRAYVCYGDDVAVDPIPGRVCVGAVSCPYLDPYLAQGGSCRSACAVHGTGSGLGDGYAACAAAGETFSRVITTWKK